MDEFLKNPHLIHTIQKPLRYVGREYGLPGDADKKLERRDVVRWCLVVPDLYEIGASGFGPQLLFWLINSSEDSICDRIFAPWVDLLEKIEKGFFKLKSLWLHLAPEDFDIIGFSISTELQFSTALRLLKLMRREIKNENLPIFIAGGPAVVNPAVLWRFFDAFFIGEGEEGIGEINRVIKEAKISGEKKEDVLKSLSKIEGIYVPSFHGAGEKNHPPPVKIKRRIIKELDSSFHPEKQLVPLMDVVHNRINIEVARGCPHTCRFCLASFNYRPIRERSPYLIYELAKKLFSFTGFQEISLLSLSTGDHSSIEEIISLLHPFCKKNSIILNLPSLRIGSLSMNSIKKIASLGKRGYTIAPEAGTENLRKKINKPIKDDEILEEVLRAIEMEWKGVKMYFMLGLPGETEEDVLSIVRLIEKIKKEAQKIRKNARITLNLSPFVPKPHTPFQWFRQNFDHVREKLNIIRRNLKNRGIIVRWHSVELSILEDFLSKGDWGSGRILEEAVEKGCYLDTWEECFRRDIWLELIGKYKEKVKEMNLDEALPWDFINLGAGREFLMRDYRNSENSSTFPDCRNPQCKLCGTCDGEKIFVNFAKRKEGCLEKFHEEEIFKEEKLRLNFQKTFPANLLSPSELNNALIFSLRRAGISLRYRGKHNPRPVISSSPALSFGIESLDEFMEFSAFHPPSPEKLKEALKEKLPDGIFVKKVEKAGEEKKSLFEKTSGALFLLKFKEDEDFLNFLQALRGKECNESLEICSENSHEKNITIYFPADEKKSLNIFKVLEKLGIKRDILIKIEIVKLKHFFNKEKGEEENWREEK